MGRRPRPAGCVLRWRGAARYRPFCSLDSLIAGEIDIFFNAIWHLILPASVLGFFSLAYIARMTRSFMLDQLAQEYVTTARVKGVSERLVIWRHAFRPILVPLITVIGLSYAGLLEGSVMIETIFSWPGIGNYLTTALLERRYERCSGRDTGDRRGIYRHQQTIGRALPRSRSEGALMTDMANISIRDWLLNNSPGSRLQARLGRSYRAFRALLRNPLAVIGGIIILTLIFMAVFAPLITSYSPIGQNLAARLTSPSSAHWMGNSMNLAAISGRAWFMARRSRS